MSTPARTLGLAALALALAGCATTYTDATNPLTGLAGGYYDLKGPGKLTIVGFSGNGYTDAETARTFVLRRACEVVREQGKGHFLAFTTLEQAAAGRTVGEDLGIHALGGKPFSMIYILPLDAAQPGAMSVDDLLPRLMAEKES
jgi:hypothetical protein